MNIRKQQISAEINESGSATVISLSSRYNVSVETIRRDLKELEKKGKLIRVHGGAISYQVEDAGTSFINRAKSNVNKKRDLVRKSFVKCLKGQ